MTTLLTIQNLKKRYNGGTIALDGINLEVKTAEFIAVIGPSGAGKSTLLRCINRLIEPSEGSISFQGQRIDQMKAKELRQARSRIGMIFQHYNLVNRLSVLENVLHGRLGYMSSLAGVFNRYSEADKQDAIALLQKVGLDKEVYKRADELSGGQKQRVGVCRALAQKPKLILADEPIASLDPRSSAVVMDAIHRNCTEQGIACLVNLHQVETAKQYASRIVGIKGGKIVFDGPPQALTDYHTSLIYEGKEHEMFHQTQEAM
ncbi:phosphonate ABC transporter ATP-binding protein [Paenibacillus thiaminolyticus]|uniref:Phosphonate ABC transporter ATP-binding protein n=1 Tax=Paenibacillus thiaminolyticus TaxID=49283 RepID=A0AAP9J2P9_PANTH|nr:phosphonate ABC transporter ATP-binding protein [Paenibacillus thiaminolyticus]MCY9535275.1 phosphonate ABC transporter ATP-binding protein [Paenibacillus thiaminolyticus]MCY9602536.1 phosphonate ABC transporter ATP-binding protein [Paenibacillus thiaminolyticus]MCY9606188.1 phosphonate ABC transporter ATP-binding protein [Paenibacillus thiaminolyticus]MCY9612573.1 phosphonate ABC transporter ATP-binding protein [Paenibacillus thiaminolyticus]MCY9620798.1 phosphonate ABC transporter ATP-bin